MAAVNGCCRYQQTLSTCPLNHTDPYDISLAPALYHTLALETAGLVRSSVRHQVWLGATFDSLLVDHLHEEALLVHVPAVDPVLSGALVQQPVHKRCTCLSVAVDPGDGLQA